MKLRKVDYELPENKALSIREASNLVYHDMIGIFGKNGAGKTRFLKAVYNTIKAASIIAGQTCVENMPADALNKVLFLNAAEILQIKHGSKQRPEEKEGGNPLNEALINRIGLQRYIIENGRQLLTYIGINWFDIQESSEDDFPHIFFELFNHFFSGRIRTVVDCYTLKPQVQIDGLDIDVYTLSDGEWVEVFYLLLIAITKCLSGRYDDAILLIDEIENYLNPQSIRNILSHLEAVFKEKGQLWIASHSLDVLLYLDGRNCFWVERRNKETFIHKPCIEHYSKIREELYGNDIDAQCGQSFRENEVKHYFSEFMIQCLKEPKTVKCINQKDVQLRLFMKCLKEEKEEIDILDFGAGEGRIGEALQDLNDERISYYAYDIKEENVRKIQQRQLAKRVYGAKEEISKKFDVVLLCNVLHEMYVWCWEEDLNFIFSRLKENGVLIFIEDLELPVGEYIDETGFLLLDGEMSTILFGQENISLVLAEEERYRDRILCAVINAKGHIAKEDVLRTLRLLKKRSIEKIWQIRRNRKADFIGQPQRLGTEIARAAQLAVNADIAAAYLQAVDAGSVENMQEFVKCFTDAVSMIKGKKIGGRTELEDCLKDCCGMFVRENEKDWVVQGNIALTGTLLQKLNKILEKANLTIYSEQFECVADLYIRLRIMNHIADNGYSQLMCTLLYLDICRKFEGKP